MSSQKVLLDRDIERVTEEVSTRVCTQLVAVILSQESCFTEILWFFSSSCLLLSLNPLNAVDVGSRAL